MKEREVFLDKMRAAAACAVVLLHTVTGVLNAADMSLYPLENKIFLILMDLSCWCVPVFLLISGYLFLSPARKISMGKMLTRYCRRVVLALFLFGVPYACLELMVIERGFRWGMIGEAFSMVLEGKSWSHMWYLYLILVLYLLTPGLKWVLFRIPKPTVYVLLGVLLMECSVLPFMFRFFEMEERAFLPDQGIYLFYYICGYLLAERKAQKEKTNVEKDGSRHGGHGIWSGYCLSAISFLLIVAVVYVRWSERYHGQMAYNDLFTVVLSLALFGREFQGEGQKVVGRGRIPWKDLADLSFTVYLIHPVFLNMAYKFFHITPLSFPLGISLPCFFLGTLLLAAACAWVLRKIPPLKKYVL